MNLEQIPKPYDIKDSILAVSLNEYVRALKLLDSAVSLSDEADEAVENIKQAFVEAVISLCHQYPESYHKDVGEYVICVSNYGKTSAVTVVWDHNGCMDIMGINTDTKYHIGITLDAPAFDYELKTTSIDERCADAMRNAKCVAVWDCDTSISKATLLSNYMVKYIMHVALGEDAEKPHINILYRLTQQITKLNKALAKVEAFKHIVSTGDSRGAVIAEYLRSPDFRETVDCVDEYLNTHDINNVDDVNDFFYKYAADGNSFGTLVAKHKKLLCEKIAAEQSVNYNDTASLIDGIYELLSESELTLGYFVRYVNGCNEPQSYSGASYMLRDKCRNKDTDINAVMNEYQAVSFVPKAEFTGSIAKAAQTSVDKLVESLTKTAADESLYFDRVSQPARLSLANEALRTARKYTDADKLSVFEYHRYWSNVSENMDKEAQLSVMYNMGKEHWKSENYIDNLIREYLVPRMARNGFARHGYQDGVYGVIGAEFTIDELHRMTADQRAFIEKHIVSDKELFTEYAECLEKDLNFYISMLKSIQDMLLKSEDTAFLQYLADTKVLGKREVKLRISELTKT